MVIDPLLCAQDETLRDARLFAHVFIDVCWLGSHAHMTRDEVYAILFLHFGEEKHVSRMSHAECMEAIRCMRDMMSEKLYRAATARALDIFVNGEYDAWIKAPSCRQSKRWPNLHNKKPVDISNRPGVK